MIERLKTIYQWGLGTGLDTYAAFKLQIVNQLAILCVGIAGILVVINIIFHVFYLSMSLPCAPTALSLVFNNLKTFESFEEINEKLENEKAIKISVLIQGEKHLQRTENKM